MKGLVELEGLGELEGPVISVREWNFQDQVL